MATIVHCSNSSALARPGQPRSTGGIETLQLQIFDRQLRDGHNVVLVNRSADGTIHDWVDESGVRVIELPTFDGAWRTASLRNEGLDATQAKFGAQFRSALESVMKAGSPTVVHIHNFHKPNGDQQELIPGKTLVDMARSLGAKTVHHIHNYFEGEMGIEGARAMNADQQVFVSNAQRAYYERGGAVQPAAAVVPVAVDTRLFHADGPPHPRINGQTGVKIGVPGRLVKEKGVLVVVEALSLLAKHAPKLEWSLTLCDNGPDPKYRALVDNAITDGGIADRVHFESIPFADMPAAMRSFDLGVVTSVVDESGPQTLLELVATNTAFVTTRGGGQEELTRKVLGDRGEQVLATRNDEQDLCRVLANLLRDPDLRSRFAAEAYGHVADFDSQVSTKKLAAVYATMGVDPVRAVIPDL